MNIQGKASMLGRQKTISLKDWLRSKKNSSLIGIRLGAGKIADQASIRGNTYLLVKEEYGYEIYIARSSRRYSKLKGRRLLIHKTDLTNYNNWRLRSTFEIKDDGRISDVFVGPRTFELWSQRPSRTKMFMARF